jgi:hypothetical protein
MKINLILFIFLAFFVGCASKPVPAWKNAASNQLENFKYDYLIGNTQIAEMHFNKAVEEIKKSGDLEILEIAYLTKYAVQIAVLEKIDDNEYKKIEALYLSLSNRNFHAFLTGNLTFVERNLLPEQYQRFYTVFQNTKSSAVTDKIIDIEDPLSRLVATGLVVLNNSHDERCLQNAIATASENGWKKALLVYLEKLHAFYEIRKEFGKTSIIQNKIDLIK